MKKTLLILVAVMALSLNQAFCVWVSDGAGASASGTTGWGIGSSGQLGAGRCYSYASSGKYNLQVSVAAAGQNCYAYCNCAFINTGADFSAGSSLSRYVTATSPTLVSINATTGIGDFTNQYQTEIYATWSWALTKGSGGIEANVSAYAMITQ